MKNYDSHIYLYAKNWYERKDPISDLKVLFGKSYQIDPEYINVNDILNMLLEITFKHIKNERQFKEFVFDMSPETVIRVWKFHGLDSKKDYTYERAIISKCLSVLCLAEITDIPNGLDEADYSILPKSKYIR